MVFVEGVDNVVLIRVGLVGHFDILLDESNELLHLLPEERIDVIHELVAQILYLIKAGSFHSLIVAFRTDSALTRSWAKVVWTTAAA